MRIIHVFRAPLGGLFRHVLDLAREQIARGHDVGIFCDSTTGGPRSDAALAELEPRLTLGLKRIPIARNPGFGDIRALMDLRAHCKALRPDVLHGHGSKGGVYARAAGCLGGIGRPVRIYTPHGGSFNYFPGSTAHRVYMGVERLMARRTDLFMCESAFIADRLREAVGETDVPVRVVHNGIYEHELVPITPMQDPFDLLYLGELRFAKGIDTLLEALVILRARENSSPSLLLVGSGPEEAALKQRAEALGLTSQVTFDGPGPIRAALARARIMVVPSRAESLPYVILEAAAAAQPLVSTHAGGIPEIFGPFGDRLIPPDDADALAAALSDALKADEADLRQRAAQLADFVGRNFSLKAMVDGVLEGYATAMAARR